MSDFNPKVSIVIPVYNGSNYMREAIDSALAQTYNNIEIIVVNDGSTDNTEEIALSYGDKIRYFKKENGGQSSALNYGIEKMEGEYFSWLSHDDVYYPNKIKKQIDYLKELDTRDDVFLFGNYEIIDRNSKFVRKVIIKGINQDNFLYRYLLDNPINGCTVLIKKEHLIVTGMFRLNRPNTSDVELFLKLACRFKPHLINDVIVKSRSHPQQVSRTNMTRFKKEVEEYVIDILKIIRIEDLVKASGFIASKTLRTIIINWGHRGLKKSLINAIKVYYKYERNLFIFLFISLYAIVLSNLRNLKRYLVNLINLL